MVQIQQVLKVPLARWPNLLRQLGLAPAHQCIVASLLQQSRGCVRDAAPACDATFGITRQMKESFESTLEGTEDEKALQDFFAVMKPVKTEEISPRSPLMPIS